MTLTISLKAEGMKAADAMLKEALGVQSAYRGVELIGTQREPYPGQPAAPTNREILERLATDKGLELIPTDDDTAEAVAQAYADELEKRLQAALAKEGGTAQGKANTAAAGAYRAAMKELRMLTVKRIEDNDVGKVQPGWAKKRAALFGVPDDTSNVGKASGQLLSDLNPSGSKATIRLLQ